MHNLGTQRRVFSSWINQNILSNADQTKIQERIEQFCSASDAGRLPGNLILNYCGFTAAQWKNSVLLYSMYVLKGILPVAHLNYWQSFVLACKYLCQPCISKVVKEKKAICTLRSVSWITEALTVFGSSILRFNGILVLYQTNARDTEVHVMGRFTTSGFLSNMQFSLPKEYEEFLLEQCLSIISPNAVHDNILDRFSLYMTSTGPLRGKEKLRCTLTSIIIPSTYKLGSLDSESKDFLVRV